MGKRIFSAGLLAGLVMIVWTFVVNGLFGFQASLDMKRLDAEAIVYAVLAEHVTEPGRYTVNPPVTAEGRFPGGEPAFGVLYSGMGHEAAGWLMIVQLPLFFALPLLATWLLSRASPSFLARFGRKVLFFAGIGLLLGLARYQSSFGIAGYPAGDALLIAVHDALMWTAMGFVVAWRLRAPAA